mgnify:CR=1 FL=1
MGFLDAGGDGGDIGGGDLDELLAVGFVWDGDQVTVAAQVAFLNFAEGGIIVFRKHNSEPLDLRVNNQRIGSVKTIKVGEKFGLHVREIGPPKETLEHIVGR